MRKLFVFALLLAVIPLMGQHRVTRIISPMGKNDDPSTTDFELRSNEGFEVHLDEDDATDGASNNSTFTIYDGANALQFQVEEVGAVAYMRIPVQNLAAPTAADCNAAAEVGRMVILAGATPTSGQDGLYVCLNHGGTVHWSNNFAH